MRSSEGPPPDRDLEEPAVDAEDYPHGAEIDDDPPGVDEGDIDEEQPGLSEDPPQAD